MITDAQAAQLKDSAPAINKIVNNAIKQVLADVKAGKITPTMAKNRLHLMLTQPSGDRFGNNTKLSQQMGAQGPEFYLPGKSAGSKYQGGLPVTVGAQIGAGMLGMTVGTVENGKTVFKDSEFLSGGLNIGGEAISTDKIDHIFVDGYKYSGMTEKSARKQSEENEKTFTGLGVTGVYSNGDIEANMVGHALYNGVENAAQKGTDFSWDITTVNLPKLNENKNPNEYSPEVKKQVEENTKE